MRISIPTFAQQLLRRGARREEREPIFSKAYGQSDREQRIPNRTDARFHIASISMQFTAPAIMRLADEGKLKLDDASPRTFPVPRRRQSHHS
jgi:CubicO group peptidase (beta-lactamase class C family)